MALQPFTVIFLTALITTLTYFSINEIPTQQKEKLQKANKCPFGYGGENSDSKPSQKSSEKRRLLGTVLYPSDVFTCPTTAVLQTPPSFSVQDYQNIVQAIVNEYEKVNSFATGNSNPRAHFAGCILRLAGHDFMDYRKTSGGSDGCINFNDGDNAGLLDCILTSNLDEVYQIYCGQVSLADFIVIAGEAVMGRTASSYDATNYYQTGSFAQQLRDSFKAGRITQETCSTNIGNLPNAEEGCSSLETIFVNQIYSNYNSTYAWQLTAAMSGAHTLGSAHLENSGFVGYWSDVVNQGKFNNDYFRSILTKGWMPITLSNGKKQWIRSDVGNSSSSTYEMMLTSDMCLAYKTNTELAKCMSSSFVNKLGQSCQAYTKSGVYLNASAGNCCAWTAPNVLTRAGLYAAPNQDYCGSSSLAYSSSSGTQGKTNCCKLMNKRTTYGDCDNIAPPQGPAFSFVSKYAASESTWLNDYLVAWHAATQNGFTLNNLVKTSSS